MTEYTKTQFNDFLNQETLQSIADETNSQVVDGRVMLDINVLEGFSYILSNAGLISLLKNGGRQDVLEGYDLAVRLIKSVQDVLTEKHAAELVDEGVQNL